MSLMKSILDGINGTLDILEKKQTKFTELEAITLQILKMQKVKERN